MDVKLREVLPFSVSGLQVRTLNAAEQQPDSARIGPMWERFFVEDVFDKIAHKQPDSFMYGVYSNYESDASQRQGCTNERYRLACSRRSMGPGAPAAHARRRRAR